MKKIACIMLISTLTLSMMSYAQAWHEQKSFDPEALAIEFVESLAKEDFAKAAKNLDGNLKKSLTPENLESSWECLISQAGKFKRHANVCTEKLRQYHIVILTCEFERSQSEIRIVLNKRGKIAGFTIAPTKSISKQGPGSKKTLPNLTLGAPSGVGFLTRGEESR